MGVRSGFKDGITAHINSTHKCIPDQALAYLTYWNTSEKKTGNNTLSKNLHGPYSWKEGLSAK